MLFEYAFECTLLIRGLVHGKYKKSLPGNPRIGAYVNSSNHTCTRLDASSDRTCFTHFRITDLDATEFSDQEKEQCRELSKIITKAHKYNDVDPNTRILSYDELETNGADCHSAKDISGRFCTKAMIHDIWAQNQHERN